MKRPVVVAGAWFVVCVGLSGAWLSTARGDDPPSKADAQPSADDTARQQRIQQRDRIDLTIRQHLAAGQWKEAIASMLEMLEIEREVLGEDHAETDGSRQMLAEAYALTGDFDAARRYADASLALQKRLHGDDDRRTKSAQDLGRYVARLAEVEAAARAELAQALVTHHKVLQLYGQRKFQPALEPALKIAEVFRKQLGEAFGATAQRWFWLGQIRYSLEQYGESAEAFQTAADCYEKAVGPESSDRAECLQALGHARREAQQFEQAAAAYRTAWEVREKLFGAEHAETRVSLASLATVFDRHAYELEEKDELDAAHKLRTQSLELKRKLYSEGDWRIVDVTLSLAKNELLAKLSPEQRQRLTEARKQQLQASGLYRQNKAQEALATCQQAYDARREILGAEHQDTAISANLLGLIFNMQHAYPRGEAILKEAAATWRKTAGNDYPEVATTVQNLADSYEEQSRFLEAKQLTAEAWRIRSKAYGDNDEDTRRSLSTLVRIVGKMATALEGASNWETAEECRREMVELAVKLYGENDWRTTDARLMLSDVQRSAKLIESHREALSNATQHINNASKMNAEKKHAEAQALAEKALALRKAILGEDTPATILARQVLIAALRGQGKYADAEVVAKQYAESAERLYGPLHPRFAVALETWGHVLYNQEKYEPANELYRKAYSLRRQAQGDQDAETIESGVFLANSLANYAEALQIKDDFAAAKTAREQALEMQLAVRGPDAYQTIDARFQLEMTQQLAGFNIEQRANMQLANRKMAEANRLNGERKFNAAVEASEDAVRLRKEVLGDKHRLVAIAVFRLGVHVNNRGDNEVALKMLLANQELLKTTLGPLNPDYAYTLVYTAGIYRAKNDLPRALPLLRDALNAYTQSNGANGQEAISAIDELMTCLQQLAAAQLAGAGSGAGEAKKAWQEIVALTGRRYGETSPQAIDAKWGLYRTELWPSLKASQKKELLDSDKWMAIAEQKMAEVRPMDQGDFQRKQAHAAAEPAGYAAQLRQQVLGDNPATADALELLAEAQTIARDGAAWTNYRKALAIRRKTQGETHPAIARIRQVLVASVASSAPRPFKRSSNLTPAQQKRLAERDRLETLAVEQNHNGQFDVEYRTLEQVLRIEIEVYGSAHEEVEATYQTLIARASMAQAWQLYRTNWIKLGEVRKKLYGADSWQAVEARVTVANLDLPDRLNDQQSKLLSAAWNFPKKLRGENVDFRAGPNALQAAFNATETLRKALLSIVGENHLYYANSLEGQADVYRRQGNQEEADALMRKAAEIIGRVLTKNHPMYATRINKLASEYSYQAESHESAGKFDQAYELWRKRIDLLTLLHGADHWQVINARLRAVQSQRLSKVSPEVRQKIQLYDDFSGRERPPQTVDFKGPDETLKGRIELVMLLEKHLGEEDVKTIDALFTAAKVAQKEGRLSQAAEFAQRSLDLRRRVQGSNHPATARNANFLGMLWYMQADYAKAEPLLREAQQIMEKLGYTSYPVYATYLNNLAMAYEATGDYDRAEPLLRTAVNIRPPVGSARENFLKEDSFETYVDDNEVLMGQFNLAEAVPTDVRGLPPAERSAELPQLGQYVNNLALLAMVRGDFSQAEILLRQSLDLMLRKYGQQSSIEYLNGLTNLATACERLGDLEQAELLTEYVVQEHRRLTGHQSKYAIALNNLGFICQERGDVQRSETLRHEALEVQRKEIGERHPTTILTRANLALLMDRAGKSAQAAAELDAVLDIAASNLQLAAAVQSERQQLRMNAAMRGYLDQYLAVADRAKLPAEQVYRHVLGWKGVVSTRQRQMRAVRQVAQKGADPAVAKMYQELTQVNQQLASLSFGGDTTNSEEPKGATFGKLSLRKDELERDLASKNDLFNRQRKTQRLTPAEIKAMLPLQTALVDLVEYDHTTYPSDTKSKPVKERRLAAFVVRSGADITRVELGPVEPIEKLVDRCRESWLQGRAADAPDPAVELRALLWQPVAEHLGDATTVLVSPDGAASRVPFAALPGSKPDTYLIEDLTIAILPVPQLLGELLAERSSATRAAAEAGLLLMGDIDFDAEPGSANAKAPAAARDGTLSKFGPLPGTLAEVQAVGKLFSTSHKQAAKVLEKSAATEDAFRQQAAGAAYLHLATHGFFAPPTVKRGDVPHTDFLAAESEASQACEGWNPGLLSGIVMAGVNRPIDGGKDDGIVTAAEVSDLNLSQAQLVVLSACETGLGQIAGGEGALGLQRAFQVAGARSVVSSLWKVDDAATQLLMTQFYENLWIKKLPPLTAFREAQLSLLRGKVDTTKLRGLDLAVKAAQPAKESGRLSPRLWAAFVVSGGLQ